MKRVLSILAAFLLLLSAAQADEDPLQVHAAEIGAAMRRLAASPDYVAAMGAGSREIAQLCAGLGEGDTQPSRILCYTFDRAEDIRRMHEESNDVAARLSSWELSVLLDRMVAAIPMQLNAYQGVEAVAAASLLTYGTSAAAQDAGSCRLYVLEYGTGTPVMVCAIPGEDAVSMTGTFLMNPDWEELLADLPLVHPLPIE